MKRITLVVPILIVFLASVPFSTYSNPAVVAARSICGPLVGGHTVGNAPTVFCEDGKPFLDVHITDPSAIGKPCPVALCGAVITGGYEAQGVAADYVREEFAENNLDVCGPLVAGHLPDGSAPTFFCEDGKPLLDTHVTSLSEEGKPCPVELCAVVLIGGRQTEK